MISILIAAATTAATSNITSAPDPADSGAIQQVVVEGRRPERDWDMPKLEYDEPESCPALVQTDIPGFGVLRLSRSCAADRTEEWRLFQH